MTQELTNLFNGLNLLCENNEAFSFSEQDIIVNEKTYKVRSFTYRLASWSEFNQPYGSDSRGTAFYQDSTGEWNLFCRAYQKFHNLGEGISIDKYIKKHQPIASFEKLDGSLILVGRIDGKLITKSKTSVTSGEALKAQQILDNNILLTAHLNSLIDNDFTPVFELVGPDNIIVLKYEENDIILLGIVDNITAKVSTYEEGELEFVKVPKQFKYTWEELFYIQDNSETDIEGFVVLTDAGFVKVKGKSYVALHTIRTNLNDLKSLATLIISDSLDDLIPFHFDSQESLDYIETTRLEISSKYNHLLAVLDEVRSNDLSLDRRDFAMKHQKENKPFFPILMQMYLGKDIYVNQFFINQKLYI